ncbi:hypothetical protein KC953_03935 [Candidatus Saccharibacteria bacterium]|nr:hypothetical protein [Candidatus Saccharibacteria bacterium]
MVPDYLATFVHGTRDDVRQRMESKSSPEILIGTVLLALNAATTSRSLMSHRNPMYVDGPKLSKAAIAFQAFGFVSASLSIFINCSELQRRVQSGESLFEIDPIDELDATYLGTRIGESNTLAYMALRGKTLFKKHALSTYGRLVNGARALALASYVGIHLAGVKKAQ